jgi:hypothetical protein
MNYGSLSSLTLDPVEKKPLYPFHPGSYLFSVGSYGCNLGACSARTGRYPRSGRTLYRAKPTSGD